MVMPAQWAIDEVNNQSLARELRERLPELQADISIREIARSRERHQSWEKRFGEVVRGWRHDRGWSQEDVAEKLRHQGFDMHQTTIAKIERGARPLRVAEATALAEVFRMPVMAVFEMSLPEDQPEELRERQERLDEARASADEALNLLYSVAERHAFLVDQIEKILVQMNDHTAEEERGQDGSEA